MKSRYGFGDTKLVSSYARSMSSYDGNSRPNFSGHDGYVRNAKTLVMSICLFFSFVLLGIGAIPCAVPFPFQNGNCPF